MTVKELRQELQQLDRFDDDREVRVVFHGNESMSFNLPAQQARHGANYDYLVIVEEPSTRRAA